MTRRAGGLAAAFAALLSGGASAQHLEIGSAIGYRVPLRRESAQLVPAPGTGGEIFYHVYGQYDGAPFLAIRASLWSGRLLGLEAFAATSSGWRTLQSAATGSPSARPSCLRSDRAHATLTSAALRIALRLGSADHVQLQGALGPQLTHFAGDASDGSAPWPFTLVPLQRKIVLGVSGSLAVFRPVSGRLAMRVALDAALSRLRLGPPPPGNATQTPVLLDLAPSIGFVLRSP